MDVVIDTSVAVAWYLPESFSAEARIWQEKILSRAVRGLVPSLHYLEFANVLRTYVRRKQMESALAEDLYALHLDAPLEIVEPSRSELLRAAFEYDATAYDAAYISLAMNMDAVLLTAERTTTSWVVKLGKQARVIGR
jgi:predicted nucleic acid-binding protein